MSGSPRPPQTKCVVTVFLDDGEVLEYFCERNAIEFLCDMLEGRCTGGPVSHYKVFSRGKARHPEYFEFKGRYENWLAV